MTPASLALVTYSAQIAVVVGTAALACRLAPMPFPRVRLQVWRFVLLLCVLLPLGGLRGASAPQASGVLTEAMPAVALAAPATAVSVPLIAWLPWVVAAGTAARLAWLVIGAGRLHTLREDSEAVTMPAACRALCETIAPGADIRRSPRVSQPVAFGCFRPVILLPASFAALDADEQATVVCHELEHIARRDWLWILGEETVRAVFWFHPAIWWVLAQVHLSREQVVDEAVVTRTGCRRAYMNALMRFAEAPHAAPAIPLLRRRHLAARLRQLAKEMSMSTPRLAGTLSAVSLAVAAAATAIVLMLPINLAGLLAQTGTTLEVRLAESQPGPGLTEGRLAQPGAPVFLHPEVLATQDDVSSARVVETNGTVSINVEFTSAAAGRLSGATGGHLGRPVALMLGGRVIAAPTVRSPIGSRAVITGSFSRAEAEAIAAALGRRAGAGATTSTPAALAAVESNDPGVVLPAVGTDGLLVTFRLR